MSTPTSDHYKGHDVILSVDSDGSMHVDRDSLPSVPAGRPLVEGAVYLDIINRGHGPFRALGGQTAGSGNGFVAETEVDPRIWDLLVREDAESTSSHTESPVETAAATEDLSLKSSVEA